MKYIVLLIALNMFSIELTGQNLSSANVIKTDHQKFIFNIEKPGHISSLITRNKGIAKINNVDLSEKIKIIVEFKDEPLFIAQKKNKLFKVNSVSYTTQFSRFENDINKFNSKLAQNLKVSIATIQIEREFYKIFNGVSITIPKGILNSIYALDYVKNIHANGKVKTFENESNQLIKADSVWTKYGAEGDSIVVGILDTGIDYLHPALGGGFGKGFKVIGGYDIINDDNDPMDDHGHGTHVAGIVSANTDSIKGVAPKSLLMAFKVLDQTGYGDDAQVLAGIERALDPNNDGYHDDKVDIINMSLGDENGNPDDAASTAVNNAVELGVIFCISAGNSGVYNSIGSPGTAEKAITVGSTDKNDEISFFSSKGPNKKSFTIKPDIVAPGNNILSTLPSGTYQEKSGTSMAAPQVAGVCALLKQIHKDWTPEMIKSAIMTTAKDLAIDKMAQGSGRIDALKAAKVSTITIPSSLSYGRDIDTLNQWIKYDTLEITNFNFSSQQYDININGQTTGISLEPNINNFTLQQGETQSVIFTLTIDNAGLPYPNDSSLAYSGNVFINGEIDSIHLPWAFVKKPLLIFNTDMLPLFFEVFNTNQTYFGIDTIFDEFNRTELIIEPGIYTIVFNFDDFASANRNIRYIVKENVEIYGSKEITIKSTDAQNLIVFKGVDENGNPLDTIKNSVMDFSFTYEGTNAGPPFSYYFPINTIIKTNNFNDFVIHLRQLAVESKNIHSIRIVNYPKKVGMNGSYTFTNAPDDYIKQKFSISLQPNAELTKVMLGYYEHNDYWSYGRIDIDSPSFDVKDIIDGEILMIPNIDTSAALIKRTFFITNADTIHNNIVYPEGGSWFVSSYFETDGENIFMQSFPYLTTKNILFSSYRESGTSNIKTWNFGDGPIYTYLEVSNSKSTISIYPTFYGQLNEYRDSDLFNSFHEVYDNSNNLINSDSLYKFEPLQVKTDKYKFIVKNNNYTVDGKWGKSETISEFDLSQNNPNPPSLNFLQILNSEDIPSSKLVLNENGKLLFSVNGTDQNSFVFLKQEYDSIWTKVEIRDTNYLQNTGKYYTADLSGFTKYDSTAIDLKIDIVMTNNNKTEMILRPAFVVNYWDGIVSVEEKIETTDNIIPFKYSLNQNYPNPFNPNTIIEYSVPKREIVILKVYDILGREVETLVNQVKDVGRYKLSFDGKYFPSGVYFYKLQVGDFIETKKMVLIK